MKAHKLIKLLKKHKKYIQLSINHNEFDNKYDDLALEIEDEISNEFGLELDSFGNIYRERCI
jgi:hypothetical protein